LVSVNCGDVGVVEGGEELGLPLEPGEPLGVASDLGRENLDRHLPAELGVGGPVDLAHSSGPERLADRVGAEAVARCQSHVWLPS
jgi:hypothetical protein